MSEAVSMDIGGDWALHDFLMEEREDIQEDRDRRLNALKGKYIIVSDGKKGLVYLQDRRISKDHYWTKFLSNAISFSNKESALYEVGKLKYNNPRIAMVNINCKLEFINPIIKGFVELKINTKSYFGKEMKGENNRNNWLNL